MFRFSGLFPWNKCMKHLEVGQTVTFTRGITPRVGTIIWLSRPKTKAMIQSDQDTFYIGTSRLEIK